MQSEISWQKQGAFTDIVYEKADGIARVTINRPSRRNAFTPETIAEMLKAFSDARDDASIGVVLLRGATRRTMGSSPSVLAATKRSAAIKKGATWVRMASLASTS